jgi:hypothetical protein
MKYQISSKSFKWDPSYSMRAEGWTDVTKLIVAFRNFANAPKKMVNFNFLQGKICAQYLEVTAEKVKIRKYAVGFDTVQSGTLPEVKTRVIYRVSCVKVNSVLTVLLLLGT